MFSGKASLRTPPLFVAGVVTATSWAHATLFQAISPADATFDSSGDLVENGVTYLAVYKPTTPPPAWVKPAWISNTGGYNGDDALGTVCEGVAGNGKRSEDVNDHGNPSCRARTGLEVEDLNFGHPYRHISLPHRGGARAAAAACVCCRERDWR